ncbi:LOW QUALITY PROTEIN: Restriction endonuclease [Dulcicalothrix desertica PCC 7102]|nr:LOW QUALITY PROTEIN: Restriction endonuclease [Dulcicalothrix desertica PCC 7102]
MTTNFIFVLDSDKKPLTMCTAGLARKLLDSQKAALFKWYPTTIILKKSADLLPLPYLELRIDPGSKFTGIALVDIETETIVWAMESEHRGLSISESLTARSNTRHARRSRNTRYRKERPNHKKPSGWLPPSLQHRVDTTMTWVKRIIKLAPIKSIAFERVKFDIQKLENPSIEGIEYQQGTLQGYTLREALLEHWGRKCAYCDAVNVPLEIEHIRPKSQGGSDRFNNLTLSCQRCNQNKSNQSIDEFLKNDPVRLDNIKRHQKQSLRDAAAVNSTRNKLFDSLKSFNIPAYCGSGAYTKMMRIKSNLPKTHFIDAGCVNALQEVTLKTIQPLRVKCNGHGNRQFVTMDKHGFPRSCYAPKHVRKDWKAGDIIKVKKKDGTSVLGRVKKAAKTLIFIPFRGKETSFSPKNTKPIHRSDGYRYSFTTIDSELLQKIAT